MDRNEQTWVWQDPNWPNFSWDDGALRPYIARFDRDAAWLSGALEFITDDDLAAVHLDWLEDESVETAAIEGEALKRESVRASLLHYFGLQASQHASRAEQGMARMAVDAFRTYDQPLTHEMLWQWHLMLMSSSPTIRTLGAYRSDPSSIAIVSVRRGRMEGGRVHYRGPPGTIVHAEMERFMEWYNREVGQPGRGHVLPLAGAAHLYFESIHPFEDGNGRIGRALAEKALSQGLGRPSLIPLSRTIHKRQETYYRALEGCKASLDASAWQTWFADMAIDALHQGQLRLVRQAEQARLFGRLDGQINARQDKALMRLFREEPEGFKGGLSAGNYQTITGAPPATATRDLADLVDKGALRKTGQGRYTRYWLNVPRLDRLRSREADTELESGPKPRSDPVSEAGLAPGQGPNRQSSIG
ncbi:MAG: Fic family protein [Gammaproteobacteria bacterium]|nr:Fic family protein [Gammaproteobacteria bacterium]